VGPTWDGRSLSCQHERSECNTSTTAIEVGPAWHAVPCQLEAKGDTVHTENTHMPCVFVAGPKASPSI
jgi:hypothetical protein